jgi:hypothetical protein
MAELLFITPQEMSNTTILSGNVDIDKYTFCIANVQITTIEPLLGTELYEKIIEDITDDTLSGLYLEMFNRFVKPITKAKATAEYIEIASYILDNGGLYKHTGENIEVVDKQEAQFLSNKYNAMAQMYVQRFDKWICKNVLPEYKRIQDDVNAMKDVKLTAGWKLDGGRNQELPWYLQ